MFSTIRMGAACAAGITLVATAPSLAQSSQASAQIQFSYELIDLAPGDGIQAAITFTEQSQSFSQHASYGNMVADSTNAYGQTSLQLDSGSARTVTSPTEQTAAASMFAWVPPAHEFFAVNMYTMEFELTPWTGFRFTSTATVDADSQANHQAPLAHALVFGVLRRWGSEPVDRFFEEVETRDGARTQALNGYLSSGDARLNGTLDVVTEAGVDTPPGPVPEPSTWSMLLAGLGLVGRRLYQQQRQRSIRQNL